MNFQASLLNELINTWCINLMFYSKYQAKMNTIPRREGRPGGRDAALGASLGELPPVQVLVAVANI